MMIRSNAFSLDSLAIQLAAQKGLAWNEMSDFPAYMRNVWRDEAREHVLRTMPGAVLEILTCPWEGGDAEYLVMPPARN